MSNNDCSNTKIKFTRGEKCIFVHLIITFVLIIAMIMIYFVHLCMVNHIGNEMFRVTRRSSLDERNTESKDIHYQSIGIVYLNITPSRILCNTILLRRQWSLAPAHCTAMQSDPDIAYLLPYWKIKYKTDNSLYLESGVKRSISHSHFNKDDFINNIGLFEHINQINIIEYLVLNKVELTDDTLHHHSNSMIIVGWERKTGYSIAKVARHLNLQQCSDFVSPIVNQLRNYEFCVTIGQKYDSSLDHGAALIINSNIVGFFSWGDKRGKGVPLIILNVTHFKDWFENIIFL